MISAALLDVTTDQICDHLCEWAIHINLETCGSERVLIDRGRLEGAVGRPFATWGGQMLHRGVARRGAVLCEGILQAHPFDDGNKRTAWLLLVYFLGGFGWAIRGVSDQEGFDVVCHVVEHSLNMDQFTKWIADHLQELE